MDLLQRVDYAIHWLTKPPQVDPPIRDHEDNNDGDSENDTATYLGDDLTARGDTFEELVAPLSDLTLDDQVERWLVDSPLGGIIAESFDVPVKTDPKGSKGARGKRARQHIYEGLDPPEQELARSEHSQGGSQRILGKYSRVCSDHSARTIESLIPDKLDEDDRDFIYASAALALMQDKLGYELPLSPQSLVMNEDDPSIFSEVTFAGPATEPPSLLDSFMAVSDDAYATLAKTLSGESFDAADPSPFQPFFASHTAKKNSRKLAPKPEKLRSPRSRRAREPPCDHANIHNSTEENKKLDPPDLTFVEEPTGISVSIERPKLSSPSTKMVKAKEATSRETVDRATLTNIQTNVNVDESTKQSARSQRGGIPSPKEANGIAPEKLSKGIQLKAKRRHSRSRKKGNLGAKVQSSVSFQQESCTEQDVKPIHISRENDTKTVAVSSDCLRERPSKYHTAVTDASDCQGTDRNTSKTTATSGKGISKYHSAVVNDNHMAVTDASDCQGTDRNTSKTTATLGKGISKYHSAVVNDSFPDFDANQSKYHKTVSHSNSTVSPSKEQKRAQKKKGKSRKIGERSLSPKKRKRKQKVKEIVLSSGLVKEPATTHLESVSEAAGSRMIFSMVHEDQPNQSDSPVSTKDDEKTASEKGRQDTLRSADAVPILQESHSAFDHRQPISSMREHTTQELDTEKLLACRDEKSVVSVGLDSTASSWMQNIVSLLPWSQREQPPGMSRKEEAKLRSESVGSVISLEHLLREAKSESDTSELIEIINVDEKFDSPDVFEYGHKEGVVFASPRTSKTTRVPWWEREEWKGPSQIPVVHGHDVDPSLEDEDAHCVMGDEEEHILRLMPTRRKPDRIVGIIRSDEDGKSGDCYDNIFVDEWDDSSCSRFVASTTSPEEEYCTENDRLTGEMCDDDIDGKVLAVFPGDTDGRILPGEVSNDSDHTSTSVENDSNHVTIHDREGEILDFSGDDETGRAQPTKNFNALPPPARYGVPRDDETGETQPTQRFRAGDSQAKEAVISQGRKVNNILTSCGQVGIDLESMLTRNIELTPSVSGEVTSSGSICEEASDSQLRTKRNPRRASASDTDPDTAIEKAIVDLSKKATERSSVLLFKPSIQIYGGSSGIKCMGELTRELQGLGEVEPNTPKVPDTLSERGSHSSQCRVQGSRSNTGTTPVPDYERQFEQMHATVTEPQTIPRNENRASIRDDNDGLDSELRNLERSERVLREELERVQRMAAERRWKPQTCAPRRSGDVSQSAFHERRDDVNIIDLSTVVDSYDQRFVSKAYRPENPSHVHDSVDGMDEAAVEKLLRTDSVQHSSMLDPPGIAAEALENSHSDDEDVQLVFVEDSFLSAPSFSFGDLKARAYSLTKNTSPGFSSNVSGNQPSEVFRAEPHRARMIMVSTKEQEKLATNLRTVEGGRSSPVEPIFSHCGEDHRDNSWSTSQQNQDQLTSNWRDSPELSQSVIISSASYDVDGGDSQESPATAGIVKGIGGEDLTGDLEIETTLSPTSIKRSSGAFVSSEIVSLEGTSGRLQVEITLSPRALDRPHENEALTSQPGSPASSYSTDVISVLDGSRQEDIELAISPQSSTREDRAGNFAATAQSSSSESLSYQSTRNQQINPNELFLPDLSVDRTEESVVTGPSEKKPARKFRSRNRFPLERTDLIVDHMPPPLTMNDGMESATSQSFLESIESDKAEELLEHYRESHPQVIRPQQSSDDDMDETALVYPSHLGVARTDKRQPNGRDIAASPQDTGNSSDSISTRSCMSSIKSEEAIGRLQALRVSQNDKSGLGIGSDNDSSRSFPSNLFVDTRLDSFDEPPKLLLQPKEVETPIRQSLSRFDRLKMLRKQSPRIAPQSPVVSSAQDSPVGTPAKAKSIFAERLKILREKSKMSPRLTPRSLAANSQSPSSSPQKQESLFGARLRATRRLRERIYTKASF